MKLTNKLDYRLTLKRFEMMFKQYSLFRSSSKLLFISPIILIMIVVHFNDPDSLSLFKQGKTIFINGVEVYSEPKIELHFEHPGYGILAGSNMALNEDWNPFSGAKQFFRADDNKLVSEFIYSDGYLEQSIYYDEEVYRRRSRSEFYYQNGMPSEVHYFDADGNLIRKRTALYRYNQHIGHQTFDPQNNLIGETLLINANDEGIASNKTWHSNGQLKYEVYFKEARAYHGLMTSYDENGNILEQSLYDNGELVETIK